MRKTLLWVISVCCIVSAFTSCGKIDSYSSVDESSHVEEKTLNVEVKPFIVENKHSEDKSSDSDKKPFKVEDRSFITEDRPSDVQENLPGIEDRSFISEDKTSAVIVTAEVKPVSVEKNVSDSDNDQNDAGTPVTEAETEKAIVTEPPGIDVPHLISDEKLNSYRNDMGLIYIDVNSMICANLTIDEDGYNLAICSGTEYIPEKAAFFISFNDFGEEETSVLVENGSQKKSDIYSIHGCFECLCLDVTDPDGIENYKYSLYPADNFPDDTSPNKNLTEFSSTLDNYNWKDRLFNQEMPDFFNDDQKRLFANAEYLMDNFELEAKFNSKQSYILRDNWRYFQTGESYESFVYYTESVFTPQLSAALLNQDKGFLNVRGEMCFTDGARGAHITYSSRSFNLISQNDKEIKFKLIAHNSFKGVITEDAYNNLPDEEKEFDKEYTFTMIKTLDGWRFSEFNYWK